ncbi:MAG: hypothetical protein ACXVPN_01735 [Bacteroidia bacterium]
MFKNIIIGKIFHLNPVRGMYSIKQENGDFLVFETPDSVDLNFGDIISGDFSGVDAETFLNETEGESFSVIVQNTDCNEATAKERTLL